MGHNGTHYITLFHGRQLPAGTGGHTPTARPNQKYDDATQMIEMLMTRTFTVPLVRPDCAGGRTHENLQLKADESCDSGAVGLVVQYCCNGTDSHPYIELIKQEITTVTWDNPSGASIQPLNPRIGLSGGPQ